MANSQLSPIQAEIKDAIAKVAAQFPDAYWRARDAAKEFPWEFYDAIAGGGWLGICMPKAYGGGELGIAEAGVMLEEIAASGAAMNGCSALHLTVFGMNPVVKHGSDQLKDEFLPRVVSGDLHVAFGVTEPDAGTDTSRITTFARRDGDAYVVSGRKVWTSKALEAEVVLLLARTTPREECARGVDGMTLFLAPLDHDRCTIRPIEKMGRNAVDSNELFIDDLVVPVERRIGEEGHGFRYLLDGLNPERILLAFEAVGIGRRAVETAVAYAKERVVFGRPIGMNQAIQFPLAEAAIRLDAASLMAHRAADLYDAGVPCGREANAAKFLCADAGFRAADQAVQTLGGYGYATEFNVERYFREARLLRLAPISQEMALSYIGEHCLHLPRSF